LPKVNSWLSKGTTSPSFILILYCGHKYIIETKIFIDASYFKHGKSRVRPSLGELVEQLKFVNQSKPPNVVRTRKSQLADYLASEGLAEGFYVGFTSKHSAADTLYFDEMIKGQRIYTWLIRTDFKAPSRRVANFSA